MFLLFLFIFFAFAYLILLLNLASAWRNLPDESLSEDGSNLFISVIVPFRNEENNLPKLLQKLSLQSYKHFELILVNDHSTDSFLDICTYYQTHLPLKLIHTEGSGKKNALKEGITYAKGQLIVCTDADCEPSAHWLEAIAQYQEKVDCDLLICPVQMTYGNTLFSKLQALEFSSLIAVGAAAAAMGKPVLCNGANLAFTPACWENSKADLKEEEASGDDMFLLMSVKKQKGKIRFLRSKEAIVCISPSQTIPAFYNQRKRWVSKSKSYTDWDVIILSILVLGLSVGMAVSLVAGLYNPYYWKAAVFLYFLKTLADSALLMPASKFLSIEKLLIYIPILQVIYPFYVVITAFGGLFGKFRWKA